MDSKKCAVCNKDYSPNDLISGDNIHHEIERLIKVDRPGWKDSSYICKSDYEKYRISHIIELISDEHSQIEKLESEVVNNIKSSELVTSNLNSDSNQKFTLGEKIADKVAEFGGSWKFIIIFFILLTAWIVMNSHFLLTKPFDPFPFILMNLILSCLAAIQAPIIMMSQNRQEAKDRIRGENDYKINLKAEIEIRTLHEKVDHLLLAQWSKMIEIQKLQIDLLSEIREKVKTESIQQ